MFFEKILNIYIDQFTNIKSFYLKIGPKYY